MRRWIYSIFAAAVAFALVMAGCNGKKDSALESTGKKTYTLATSAYPAFYLWYIAEQEHIFEKNGLSVEVVYFPVYSDSVLAFSTGQADCIAMALPDVIAPYMNGVPLEIIGMLDNSDGADGIVGRKGIRSISDLKGKSVATEYGTIEHFFLMKRLEEAGLTMDDIKFVNLSIADSGPAFLADTVDAASLWEPTLSEAQSRPDCNLITTSQDTPGLIADVFVVSKSMKNEDKKAFVATLFDLLDFYRTNPEKAIFDMAKCAEISEDDMKVSMSGSKLFSPKASFDTMTSTENEFTSLLYDIQQVADFLYGVKMLDKKPENLSGMVNSKYVKELLDERGDFPVPDTKKF